MGLSSAFARASASSPHGYQFTGLCACCLRYGLDSFASRFGASRFGGCLGFSLIGEFNASRTGIFPGR